MRIYKFSVKFAYDPDQWRTVMVLARTRKQAIAYLDEYCAARCSHRDGYSWKHMKTINTKMGKARVL